MEVDGGNFERVVFCCGGTNGKHFEWGVLRMFEVRVGYFRCVQRNASAVISQFSCNFSN